MKTEVAISPDTKKYQTLDEYQFIHLLFIKYRCRKPYILLRFLSLFILIVEIVA